LWHLKSEEIKAGETRSLESNVVKSRDNESHQAKVQMSLNIVWTFLQQQEIMCKTTVLYKIGKQKYL